MYILYEGSRKTTLPDLRDFGVIVTRFDRGSRTKYL